MHYVGVAERQVLADRVHRLVAPKPVVFEALTDQRARWLRLEAGEVSPVVLESTPSERVVWSSLWPVSPDDRIEIALARFGGGTELRFQWLTNSPPDERGIGITRQRLNRKFGADLRAWTDSWSSPVSWETT